MAVMHSLGGPYFLPWMVGGGGAGGLNILPRTVRGDHNRPHTQLCTDTLLPVRNAWETNTMHSKCT